MLTFGDFPADNSDAMNVGINDVVRLEFHRGEQTFISAELFYSPHNFPQITNGKFDPIFFL